MPAALEAATSAPAKADMDLLVGSVYETDAQHRARGMLVSGKIAFAVWRSLGGRILSALRHGRRRDLHILGEVGEWAVAFAWLGERIQ